MPTFPCGVQENPTPIIFVSVHVCVYSSSGMKVR